MSLLRKAVPCLLALAIGCKDDQESAPPMPLRSAGELCSEARESFHAAIADLTGSNFCPDKVRSFESARYHFSEMRGNCSGYDPEDDRQALIRARASQRSLCPREEVFYYRPDADSFRVDMNPRHCADVAAEVRAVAHTVLSLGPEQATDVSCPEYRLLLDKGDLLLARVYGPPCSDEISRHAIEEMGSSGPAATALFKADDHLDDICPRDVQP